ncbi:MAG: serine protease [Phycisphaerae bacterium]
MFMTDHPKRSFLRLVLAALVTTAASRAVAADAINYQSVLAARSSALVTVKFVLKLKMGGMMGGMGDQETDTEITGVVIDPKGVVLCSNTQLGGFTALLSRMMGPMGGSLTATPTDLKVLVGDDTDGVEAKLIARDTELDLAWVKMNEAPEKALAHVDFSKAARPKVGDHVVGIRRMGKYFARQAIVIEGRIGGTVNKPRDLYVPSLAIATAQGLPVFTADGRVIGVTIMQMPESDDAAPNPLAMLSSLTGMQEMMSGLILPAADVMKATKRALASAEDEE